LAGGLLDRMPASFMGCDKVRDGGDQPLRPRLVGSNELGIECDQDFQLFAIRNPARQTSALKAADIAEVDPASVENVADKLLKLSVNHC
jgi:hypothetical protein